MLEAIRSLGEQRAKEAVEPLMALALDDSLEPLINRRAIQALGEIGDARAIPTLVKMMFKQHRTRGGHGADVRPVRARSARRETIRGAGER